MKSIKQKILLCMSLTIVICLGLLGSVTIFLNYRSSNQLLEQNMKETALIAAGKVSKDLEAYRNVAIDTGTIARLSDPARSAGEKQALIDDKVKQYNFQRGNIIGTDGVSVLNGVDYSDQPYFQKAMTGQACISDPLADKETGKLSIIVAAPLWEGGRPDTKVAGVVFFAPQETFLNDVVSQVHISDHSAAYAINSQGYTIADNTQETIMTQNIEEEAKTDRSLVKLAAVHGKMRNGESGFDPYKINGVDKFAAYCPIPNTDGWSIAITAPTSDFMGATYFAITMTVILMAVSLAATAVIAYKLADGIGAPIRLCVARLKGLSEGDLKSDVPHIKSRDETGILAKATESIVTNMRGMIMDMDWSLGELAAGNFTVESRRRELYVGDFGSLVDSLSKIIRQQTGTLLKINQSAEQVSSGSGQVSSGAQALAQGATEQASSVEELAATISTISGQIQETAEHSVMARNENEKSHSELMTCSLKMQNLVSAMGTITEKSKEVGKIIKTVEDIAFQTNILALNAAVEAARAGEAGKGFAVVADEVRNLAGKSADAAQNTTSLIEETIKAVEEGASISGETETSLKNVVESEKKVLEAVKNISEASSQQANSIAQVTLGIDQIASVVQTNSATAQESAAASEELSGQAQMLKSLVGQFRLRDDGGAKAAGGAGRIRSREAEPEQPVFDSGKY